VHLDIEAFAKGGQVCCFVASVADAISCYVGAALQHLRWHKVQLATMIMPGKDALAVASRGLSTSRWPRTPPCKLLELHHLRCKDAVTDAIRRDIGTVKDLRRCKVEEDGDRAGEAFVSFQHRSFH